MVLTEFGVIISHREHFFISHREHRGTEDIFISHRIHRIHRILWQPRADASQGWNPQNWAPRRSLDGSVNSCRLPVGRSYDLFCVFCAFCVRLFSLCSLCSLCEIKQKEPSILLSSLIKKAATYSPAFPAQQHRTSSGLNFSVRPRIDKVKR